MSNYTIAVAWSGKDALSDSDAAKVISGADFNTEFSAVRTAVNTKADLNGSASESFSATKATAGTDTTQVATTSFVNTAITGITTTENTFTKTQIWAKGTDVSSATTLTVGNGNYFDVTGTTAVTSIATVGVGATIKLHFDSAVLLTHSVTDLALPSGANVTTAAGDEFEFTEYATGDWRCTGYTLASGKAISSGAIGDGQTWQDVKASRSKGVTYTNSTGSPIAVAVSSQGGSTQGRITLTIDSVDIMMDGIDSSFSNNMGNVFGIVPNGSTYSATSDYSTFSLWTELR